jgi:hypothetical protein
MGDVDDESKAVTIKRTTAPEALVTIWQVSFPDRTARGQTGDYYITIENKGSKGCEAYAQWVEREPTYRNLTASTETGLNPGERKTIGPFKITTPNYPKDTVWKIKAVAGYMLSQPPEPAQPVETDHYNLSYLYTDSIVQNIYEPSK